MTIDARRARPAASSRRSRRGARRVPGNTVTLTINSALQEIAERALGDAVAQMGAEGGDIVVLDPTTGEMLAMASRAHGPARDVGDGAHRAVSSPGRRSSRSSRPRCSSGNARAIDDVVEHVQRPVSTIDRPHDHRRARGRSAVTLADVIRYSSNVGIVQFAERLTPREQYESLRDFGFGTPTGVPYPMEAAGMLREPQRWSKQSPASLAMGYEISVTPLQLARGVRAIANGGELLEPALVKEVRDPDGKVAVSASSGASCGEC